MLGYKSPPKSILQIEPHFSWTWTGKEFPWRCPGKRYWRPPSVHCLQWTWWQLNTSMSSRSQGNTEMVLRESMRRGRNCMSLDYLFISFKVTWTEPNLGLTILMSEQVTKLFHQQILFNIFQLFCLSCHLQLGCQTRKGSSILIYQRKAWIIGTLR